MERLDDSRLVKMIMEKMQDCGSEYDLLLRKYGLEGRKTAGIGWKEKVA